MENKYELMIAHPGQLKEQDVKKNIEDIKEQIQKLGGKIAKEDFWGLKDLAYEVKKNTKAYYTILIYSVESSASQAFAKLMRSQEKEGGLLRYMITKLQKKDKES